MSLNPCVFVCCLPNMLSGVRAALVTARGLRGFWCLKWQTAFLTQGMLPLMETPTMFRVVGRCFFLYSEANSVPLLPDFGMSLTRSRLALVKRSNDAALTEL